MHRLRALDDSDVRRSQLSDGGRRLVLIRPSWIGMGAAATVRTRGNGVTLLGWDPIPLPNATGQPRCQERIRSRYGPFAKPIDFTQSVQARSFRGTGRRVRSVVELVRHRAGLTGRTRSRDGGRGVGFARVTCSRVSCERRGATCCHGNLPEFPGAQCCNRCARPTVVSS